MGAGEHPVFVDQEAGAERFIVELGQMDRGHPSVGPGAWTRPRDGVHD